MVMMIQTLVAAAVVGTNVVLVADVVVVVVVVVVVAKKFDRLQLPHMPDRENELSASYHGHLHDVGPCVLISLEHFHIYIYIYIYTWSTLDAFFCLMKLCWHTDITHNVLGLIDCLNMVYQTYGSAIESYWKTRQRAS
jgi:hypothetical protein